MSVGGSAGPSGPSPNPIIDFTTSPSATSSVLYVTIAAGQATASISLKGSRLVFFDFDAALPAALVRGVTPRDFLAGAPLAAAGPLAAPALGAAAKNLIESRATEAFNVRQPDHIAPAGQLGLGVFDRERIRHMQREPEA